VLQVRHPQCWKPGTSCRELVPILLSASPIAELLPKARARPALAALAKRLLGALQKNMDLGLLGRFKMEGKEERNRQDR